MYERVTRNIAVTVAPRFVAEESNPRDNKFFWAYTVEIANQGETSVQLKSRYWNITDSKGRVQEVRGAGVVGEQPVIAPGDTFRYTSGCPLTTPDGIMVGTYQMVDEAGEAFEIDIPAFPLDSPHTRRSVH
ncbi:Co2+/Mg2+ efflux protein ApaG [Terrarubrum flagellatum]|uniref:Co2+/Mg2+ efflux protein ApaG n=1 Tax=Terrirubrum flagellatum TaxID=2895980 RepID=UPI00314517B7